MRYCSLLEAFTSNYIDDPANLSDDPVFLFSGNSDSVVKVIYVNKIDLLGKILIQCCHVTVSLSL